MHIVEDKVAYGRLVVEGKADIHIKYLYTIVY